VHGDSGAVHSLRSFPTRESRNALKGKNCVRNALKGKDCAEEISVSHGIWDYGSGVGDASGEVMPRVREWVWVMFPVAAVVRPPGALWVVLIPALVPVGVLDFLIRVLRILSVTLSPRVLF